MGKAHSHAWASAGPFFDLPLAIDLVTVAGRDPAETHEFGKRWGWRKSVAQWQLAVLDAEVDLVDVSTPNHVHADMSIAALEAGKHVACEKPLAGTLADARAMVKAAKKAKGQKTFVWFNYRRCPAVALAHQLVREGRLGKLFHVRASYLQDWGGPDTPLLWRFQSNQAGSGAHGDLNAHIIDMARFVTGQEFTEVSGAIEHTFVKERAIVDSAGGAISGKGAKGRGKRTGRSTVDDAVLFLARFSGGAIGSFEATRLATGNKNRNQIEVNGELGSIKFDFERMNELQWWDNTAPKALQGWTTIMCTEGVHPYAGNYWPPAHLIGYEQCFASMAADIAMVLGGSKPVVALPDFEDALKTQCVLEAAVMSARERRPVSLKELG
ncbi:MAG: gfo/Idh/MocA family oxidoreductase [Planctomycetota bacterium]|nr:MAG: gfo/Idh/MocA family oxidoreductase [Planctomycetota bacterium]RLS52087.1 MAG: gfo/Idh/MocA family oxidoreductase [Planctomycetota bacterium]